MVGTALQLLSHHGWFGREPRSLARSRNPEPEFTPAQKVRTRDCFSLVQTKLCSCEHPPTPPHRFTFQLTSTMFPSLVLSSSHVLQRKKYLLRHLLSLPSLSPSSVFTLIPCCQSISVTRLWPGFPSFSRWRRQSAPLL